MYQEPSSVIMTFLNSLMLCFNTQPTQTALRITELSRSAQERLSSLKSSKPNRYQMISDLELLNIPYVTETSVLLPLQFYVDLSSESH